MARWEWLKNRFVWPTVLYGTFAFVYTYPLPFQLTTHIPGVGGDAYQFYWNLWWVKYALINLHQSPYHTDLLIFPGGVSLAFHTLSIFNGFLALPLNLLTDPTISFNFVFYFDLLAAGIGMNLLAMHLCKNGSAAVIAGFIFMFSPARMVRTEGHLNIFGIQWLPFFILLMLKNFENPKLRWRYIFAAGFFFAINALTCWYQMIYSILILCFLVILHSSHRRSLSELTKTITLSILVISVAGLIMLPAAFPVLHELATSVNGLYVVGSEEYYVDLLSYLLPNHLNPVMGDLARYFAGPSGTFSGNRCEGMAAICWIPLLMILAGVLTCPRARPWFILAIIAVLLSLGPVLHIGGTSFPDVPMPFNLLMHIPVIAGTRVPGRFTIVVSICVSIISAYWISHQSNSRQGFSRSRIWMPALIFLALAFEYTNIPLKTCPTRVPALLTMVRDDPEYRAIMEWPVCETRAMMRQTVHHKPMIDGYISRNIEKRNRAFQLRKRIETQFFQIHDQDVFSPVSRFILPVHSGIKFMTLDLVYLHQDAPEPAEFARLLNLAHSVLPQPPKWRDQEIEIYQIDAPSIAFLPPVPEDGWSNPLFLDHSVVRQLLSNTGTISLVADVDFPVVKISLSLLENNSIPGFQWNFRNIDMQKEGYDFFFEFRKVHRGIHYLTVSRAGGTDPVYLKKAVIMTE